MDIKKHKYSSYGEYLIIQKKACFEKIDKTWVKKDTIKFISEILNNKIEKIEKGICHGTRTGKEQKWFSKYLKCDCIGTEISPIASKFPKTIEWDFHHIKNEWLNSMDFIYSNSLDHAYNPKKCIKSWCACLKDNGFLIIEHSLQHQESNSTDPFGISLNDLIDIIPVWTNGNYNVSFITTSPGKQYLKRKSEILFITLRV